MTFSALLLLGFSLFRQPDLADLQTKHGCQLSSLGVYLQWNQRNNFSSISIFSTSLTFTQVNFPVDTENDCAYETSLSAEIHQWHS